MPSEHRFIASNGNAVTMCDRPFVSIFPQRMNYGDEIILKGKVKDRAKVFSVNLALDCGVNIAYHFETNFSDSTVTQRYKINGQWRGESVSDNTWIDEPGQKFVITFHFDDDGILVYSGDEQRTFLYSFDYQFDVGEIKTIQCWDDVDYINEITYRFKKAELGSTHRQRAPAEGEHANSDTVTLIVLDTDTDTAKIFKM